MYSNSANWRSTGVHHISKLLEGKDKWNGYPPEYIQVQITQLKAFM
jgi:hypothetical protein